MEGGNQFRSFKFFRQRLLNISNNEDIQELLASYENKANLIKKRINDIIWHMNGAVSRSEAWVLSPAEQDYFVEKINEKIKIESKKFS